RSPPRLALAGGLEAPPRAGVGRPPRGPAGKPRPQEETTRAASGGEAARARLGEFLRRPLDVFLLDEPTNDLDFGGLDWLERELAELQGAGVLVSHDPEFLHPAVFRVGRLAHGAAR